MSQTGGQGKFLPMLQLRWHEFLSSILHIWVKAQVLPDANGEMGAGPGKIVCYVMNDYALSSVLILDKVCEQNGLARPLHAITGLAKPEHRAYAVLRRLKGVLIRRPSTQTPGQSLRC